MYRNKSISTCGDRSTVPSAMKVPNSLTSMQLNSFIQNKKRQLETSLNTFDSNEPIEEKGNRRIKSAINNFNGGFLAKRLNRN